MAPKQDSEATVAVNVEELRKSKDAVIMRLMALQSYIADLSKAYVEHVNNVVNGGPATIELPAMPIGMTGHFDFGMRASSPGAKSDAAGPKKRKRRTPVDPNAPKRALTPYFLYMQNNRAKIAQDLGSSAKPKEVSDEGTRRWQNMDAQEKEVWKQLYLENYETYKRNVAAYKAGRKPGEEEQDPAASQLQQDFAGVETAHEDNDESSDDSSDSSDSDEESPSPLPLKEKTPNRSASKRHRSDAKVAKEAASPQKRGKGKASEPVSAAKAVPEPTKRKGKKRKSEA